MRFDWDEHNTGDLLSRHGVEASEAEEAMSDPGRLPAEAKNIPGERRSARIGATRAGRILFIVYTVRNGRIRPLSARDADNEERRRYRRNSRK